MPGLADILAASAAASQAAQSAATNPNTAIPAPVAAPSTATSGSAATPAAVNTDGTPFDPSQVHSVAEPVVTAKRPTDKGPADPSFYMNDKHARDLVNAVSKEPAPPGGGDNPGLWGVLPQSVQHGTLRNVLGALGDAFLMHAGQQPEYEQRLHNQRLAIARAGMSDNPQAAIEREAFIDPNMADKDQLNYNTLQLHKDMLTNQNYYRDQAAKARTDNILARLGPTVAGWANTPSITQEKDPVKAKAAYTAAYNRADAAAKRVDPSASAADFGYIDPQDWQPGSTVGIGASTAQQERTEVGQSSVDERRWAHQHPNYRPNQPRLPTDASQVAGVIGKLNRGEPLNAGDQVILQHYQHGTKGGGAGSGLHSATTSQGGGSHGGPQPQFENGKTYYDKNGNKAMYNNGNWIPK